MVNKLLPPDVHLVPIVSPFPLGRINAYLLSQEPITLIDCGPNLAESLASLEKGLRGIGFKLEDIKQVIITHEHPDHYGSIKSIAEGTGARVYCHYLVKEIVENFSVQRERRRSAYLHFLGISGVPPAIIEYIRKDTERPAGLRSETRVSHPLREGDLIPQGETPLQVIHTPGHSPGSICLYRSSDRLLFTGDHLLKTITSNPVMEISLDGPPLNCRSLLDYLESLEKIARLEVRLCLPGHGDPILDHREQIASLREHHRQRKEQIARLIYKNPLTPYQISELLFGDLHPLEVFFGLSEVVAHLALLQRERPIRIDSRDGVTYYWLS